MECSLRVAGVIEESVADGEGLRFVVFAQGCPHRCPGCHNPKTHPVDGGRTVSVDELAAKIFENPLLGGVTLSGGEPFLQPAPLAELAQRVRRRGLNVVTYTGFLYEQLRARAEIDQAVAALLKETDLLVDGPYLEAERDLSLAFRGSRNQRLIPLLDGLWAEERRGG